MTYNEKIGNTHTLKLIYTKTDEFNRKKLLTQYEVEYKYAWNKPLN